MTLAGRTIMVVGDSWTAGAAGAALAARLRAAGVTVVLDGVVGRSAVSLTHEFPGVLATAGAVHPDAVVILLGMNDTASGAMPDAGLAEITVWSPRHSVAAYGEGVRAASAASNASACVCASGSGSVKRCDRFAWNKSPRRIAARTSSTACR